MKSVNKTKNIIFMIFGIVLALSSIINYNLDFNVANNNKQLEISKVSNRIHIIGNSGWLDFRNDGNCTGSGTYSDPYVIKDLVIDGGYGKSCILIENSNVHFKIENCTLYKSTNSVEAGIRLINTTNGQLINNNCTSNTRGIYLYLSDYNTITGNNVYNNIQQGIELWDGLYNIISGNNLNNNSGGIAAYFSNYTTISGNIIHNESSGIHIGWSKNNTILGNTAQYNYYCGMSLTFCNSTLIHGNLLNNNDREGIQIEDGVDINISSNTANNNTRIGISLVRSNYNTISGNTANYNKDSGIGLGRSDYNTVSSNTANNNPIGINLRPNSDNNIISGNTLLGNDVCILEEEDCSGNEFRDNGSCSYGEASEGIPGYSLFFLLGILSITLVFSIRKITRS